jgi:hypothetical protein
MTMRKVEFKFKETPMIEVNGHVYKLKKSDAGIYDNSLTMAAKYRALNESSPIPVIMKALKECAAIVDSILGDGAMAEIANGEPVCLTDMIEVMALITREAAASYAEKVSAYNE